ncbi:LOW QUALITY PROTEIN: membrane-spanning 4-domains subfamily A member 10 [Dugong dugon]
MGPPTGGSLSSLCSPCRKSEEGSCFADHQGPKEGRKNTHCSQASQVILVLLHLLLGAYLASVVKSLHVVTMGYWYPFWGAAFFLTSGILAIAVVMFAKAYLKTLCPTMNLISFFCVFCCIFVIIMDLFLESPHETPIWSTPNSTVHIQRLELAMLCFTYLELFLLGPTAVVAWRIHRLSAEVKALPGAPSP